MNNKKRILLVNKFYYNRGGDCIVMMNTEKILRNAGYEVAVYAMDYAQNIDSQFSHYFAPEVTFSGKGLLRAGLRTLGLGDIKASFKKILQEFDPHIVHFHNIHSYLSPVIVKMAYEHGCRVLWTLHDYKLICPSYNCLRNGSPCQLCFNDKSHVVRTRCMKNSLPASILAYVEAVRWNKNVLQKFVHQFITPSQFMRDKMIEAGYDAQKITVISNCIDGSKAQMFENTTRDHTQPPYYCYVGRLSTEKGIENLLSVAAQLPYTLYVAGTGPLDEKLRKQYATNKNIIFTGHLSAQEVVSLVTNATAMVIPSIWYENNPLSVIESLCMGTPVIGARMGGIPELIQTPESGLLFDCHNTDELKQCIEKMFEQQPQTPSTIATPARERYSEAAYLLQLEALF